MIDAISAYKAMMRVNADERPVKRTAPVNPVKALTGPDREVDGGSAADGDVVQISASKDVFTAVESFFNMGKKNRFEDFHNLSRSDKEQFVMMVAELAKAGYMGYEELMVDGKVERHEVIDKIADERVRGARVYSGP